MGDGSDSELTLFGDFELLNQEFFRFMMAICFCFPLISIVYKTYITRDRWTMSPQRIPKNLGDRPYDVPDNIDALEVSMSTIETESEAPLTTLEDPVYTWKRGCKDTCKGCCKNCKRRARKMFKCFKPYYKPIMEMFKKGKDNSKKVTDVAQAE